MRMSLATKLVALVAALLSVTSVQAQSLIRVEEDWELRVVDPDTQIDAPQVTTTMVPFGGLSEILFQVDINHASFPSFSSGGVQVRICDDDVCLTSKRLAAGLELSQQEETLTWTQVIQKANNGYYFGVINGTSSSFGGFGGDTAFTFISNSDAGIVSLNAYDARDSLENSGATYSGNRVGWLRLKKLRVVNSYGQVTEWEFNSDVQ